MAKAKGLQVIPGLEMFVQQGARQFEIWTGKPAPVAEMGYVVTKALERRQASRHRRRRAPAPGSCQKPAKAADSTGSAAKEAVDRKPKRSWLKPRRSRPGSSLEPASVFAGRKLQIPRLRSRSTQRRLG